MSNITPIKKIFKVYDRENNFKEIIGSDCSSLMEVLNLKLMTNYSIQKMILNRNGLSIFISKDLYC